MKIEQATTSFKPIILTLETMEEAKALLKIMKTCAAIHLNDGERFDIWVLNDLSNLISKSN